MVFLGCHPAPLTVGALCLLLWLCLLVNRGGLDAPVKTWLQDTQAHFEGVVKLLLLRHSARLQRLESMAQQASKQIWWPFTQHASLTPGAVQVGVCWQGATPQQQPGRCATGSCAVQPCISALT